MPKTLFTLALLLTTSLAESAGGPTHKSQTSDGGTGCGLGSLLFDGNAGIGAHSFAMTTNASLFNNTFGMSSGTLGCDANLPVRYKGERVYISANMTQLAQDMSRGNGETLAGLADVMNISQADKPQFYALTRKHFEQIFSGESVNGDQVLASLVSVLKTDTQLSKYVS
jgi:hypothetical protein